MNNKIRYVWRIITDFSAIIALGLSLFIAVHGFPNNDNLHFDYQAIIVGILTGLFTLIVGWNIYQMIDWKNEMRLIQKQKSEIEKEINYLHNLTSYNQTITYAFLCQNIAVAMTDMEKEVQKYQMLQYGILALIQFSNFPDCKTESQKILSTLITALQNTENIHIKSEERTYLIMECGRINNSDELNEFDYLITLIQQC